MRAHDFLLEYDQAKTFKNWATKVATVRAKETRGVRPRTSVDPALGEAKIRELEQVDPTPHKEYVQWLCKIYSTGTVKFEDIVSRGADALSKFQKLKIKKQLAPEHRDINRFGTLTQLESVLSNYPDVENTNVNKGKAIEYYRDNELRIIIPQDQAAACYYGQGTAWCTAAKNNNMFDRYNKKGPLYIVIPLNPAKTYHPGEKYQFHFETGSFMDDSDTPIDLNSWVKTYPQLKTISAKQAEENLTLPLLDNGNVILKKFETIKLQLISAGQQALSQNAEYLARQVSDEAKGFNATPDEANHMRRYATQALVDNSNDAATTFMSALTFEGLTDEDTRWDDCHWALGTWVNTTRFGDYLADLESNGSEIISYGCVNALASEIYKLLCDLLLPRIKENLQKYL